MKFASLSLALLFLAPTAPAQDCCADADALLAQRRAAAPVSEEVGTLEQLRTEYVSLLERLEATRTAASAHCDGGAPCAGAETVAEVVVVEEACAMSCDAKAALVSVESECCSEAMACEGEAACAGAETVAEVVVVEEACAMSCDAKAALVSVESECGSKAMACEGEAACAGAEVVVDVVVEACGSSCDSDEVASMGAAELRARIDLARAELALIEARAELERAHQALAELLAAPAAQPVAERVEAEAPAAECDAAPKACCMDSAATR
jgi:hypothetical protein